MTAITLTDGTTTVNLSPDLYWQDESAWQPVEQATQRTITGALIVSAAARLFGRPITLAPIDDESGAMVRSVIVQLQTWASVPLKVLTLTLRGVAHEVVFRHQDGAIEAKPFIHYSDVTAADYYLATVRFMEIEP